MQQWEEVKPSSNTSQDWPEEIPLVVRRWMDSKGLGDYQEFRSFSEFSLKDLRDPSLLKDLERAVERLIHAFKHDEKICLYADFDMDGTPGLALLIRGLQLCGFENLLSFQPNRFEDGYGVHREIVEEFIEQHGIDLFVTIDVGITAVDAVSAASERGVDFIITDHHQPKEVLPEAYAIVNPNQSACSSDLGHLCGTGVAFSLVLGLRRKMKELGLLEKDFDPKILLDCFAIATLTDMVPLVKENRALVKHGLLNLSRTDRLGLRALMEELGLAGKGLTSSDVAISLSPKLNALGRMNSEVQALDLFLATDPEDAKEKVVHTMRAQKSRTEIQEQGQALIEAKLAVQREEFSFVFEHSKDFYKGIVGLLATKITKKHGVPSFVGSVIDDKIVGSARAPKGMNLLEAFEAASESLTQFGGHKQAAGFELPLENAEDFKARLHAFYENQHRPKAVVQYDFTATLDELDHRFTYWLKKLEPYGVGFKPPILRLNHLFVASTRVLKEKHLKLSLKDVQGNKIDALWFFADNIDEKRQLTSKRVSLVGEPSINFYMGKENLQLLISDLKTEYDG